MADAQKQKKRFLVFSGTGKQQAAAGTAMDDADLDTRDNCTYTLSNVIQRETVYDCGQTDIFDEPVESRYKKLVVTYNAVTAQIIARWVAYLLSAAAAPTVVSGQEKHVLTRSSDDSLAGFGFIEGFEGDATTPQKYKDFKVDSISFSLNRRKNVTMTVTSYGHFSSEDVGVDWVEPACTNFTALKSKDCSFIWNSTDLSALIWQMGINLNNVVPTGDDPFPWNSIDINEFERGEKPTYPITAQQLGSRGDQSYTDAEGEAKHQLQIRLGTALTADNVLFTFPQVLMTLGDPSTVFVGEVNKSAINLNLTPHKDSSLGTPLKAEAFLAQTDAFLTT
jgi:hypothetical protein